MNVEEIISEEIKCNCCLTNENVKTCKLENCDYPLCVKCFEKVPDICPKCRRKIKESVKEIELVEIDLDEIEQIGELSRDGLYYVCCCLWITIDREDRMHYVWSWREMRKYWKYFIKSITHICFGTAILLLFLSILTIILLIGRLITHMLHIGCSDYWCSIKDDNGNVVIYCFSCLLGWSFLGVLIGGCAICMLASCCFGKKDDDC